MFVPNSKLLKYINNVLGVEIEALTLGPVVIHIGNDLPALVKQHESIHCEQWKELLILFPLIYAYDYIKGRLSGLSPSQAYKNIRAEKEAYLNECNPTYLRDRERFAWLRL